jgi:hypothetical protein
MVGICEYCGAMAAVDNSPPPGIPEIFGEALEKTALAKFLSD